MNKYNEKIHRNTKPADGEEGSVLFLMLMIIPLIVAIGVTLGITLFIERGISTNYETSIRTTYISQSGIEEAVARLNQIPGSSTVTVNGISFDPSIYFDTTGLLSDTIDNDLDGKSDLEDIDEINAQWDWQAFIVLNNGSPQLNTGSDGATFIAPTILSSLNWFEREYDIVTSSFKAFNNSPLVYTIDPGTTDPTTVRSTPNLLRIKFLLEQDFGVDIDGDGGDEIVFFNPELKTDGIDNDNTIVGSIDGTIDNESPLNISFFDPVTPTSASGYPVLMITSTGQFGGSVKTTQALFSKEVSSGELVGVCGCNRVQIEGQAIIDGYDSSLPYDPPPPLGGGTNCCIAGVDVGSNNEMELLGSDARVYGGLEAPDLQGTLNALVEDDITLGASTTLCPDPPPPNVHGSVNCTVVPDPQPCDCTLDVVTLVGNKEFTNDNGNIPTQTCRYADDGTSSPFGGVTSCSGGGGRKNTWGGADAGNPFVTPPWNLTFGGDRNYVIIPPGDYYFDSITLAANTQLVLGTDSNSNGLLDPGEELQPGENVTFYMAGDFNVSGTGISNPSGLPSTFEIISDGGDINYSGTTAMFGGINAPLSDTDLSGENGLFGSVLSNNVTVRGQGGVHVDQSLLGAITVSPGWLFLSILEQ